MLCHSFHSFPAQKLQLWGAPSFGPIPLHRILQNSQVGGFLPDLPDLPGAVRCFALSAKNCPQEQRRQVGLLDVGYMGEIWGDFAQSWVARTGNNQDINILTQILSLDETLYTVGTRPINPRFQEDYWPVSRGFEAKHGRIWKKDRNGQTKMSKPVRTENFAFFWVSRCIYTSMRPSIYSYMIHRYIYSSVHASIDTCYKLPRLRPKQLPPPELQGHLLVSQLEMQSGHSAVSKGGPKRY